jgi:hypothetical protein
VNFVGEPPEGDDRWCSRESRDPLQGQALGGAYEEDDETEIVLFSDPVLNYNLAGAGPITARPTMEADTWLDIEGAALRGPCDGTLCTLVSYLREAILERGGFGPLGKGDG